ncbi:prepilin-type N-terminal cleavage/methylation domain-containing protein [Pseudoalteromonas shioyasakiensis]|uniref:prepilin-type N-terminal cleavage/methylation domain-containing protein n=1 Tax=Pseudoalteromonas shioyasakiensis TaxID=1190813 RepID=UPI002118C867|nr:prepilin-type N-terminal cleavage/methylation domain-containing protein [Pseudoalteromonas shioyasakiensis]MCQ8879456.1 prepilin-type N-terminal cleavage/methylation domain-containing protein [Pseudoalteromonas shioyasakiensis]
MVNQTQRGFSLIELMIATSLLSMVMFTGYFAYSLYTDKWQKRADHFWQLNQNSLGTEALIRTLEAASIYIVKDRNNKFSVLFSGQQTSITLVTNTGLYSNTTALIQLQTIEQDNGLQSLLYNEMPLIDTMLLEYPQEPQWQYQHILLTDINKVNFQFYGWQTTENAGNSTLSAIDLEPGQQKPKRRWYTSHSIEENRILPSKLALYFENPQQQTTHVQVDLVTDSYRELARYFRNGA